jgi:hypothetical protein
LSCTFLALLCLSQHAFNATTMTRSVLAADSSRAPRQLALTLLFLSLCSNLSTIALAFVAILSLLCPQATTADLNLGSAAPFAIIACTHQRIARDVVLIGVALLPVDATITSSGPSSVVGDMALSPGTAVVGFGPATSSGAVQIANTVAGNALADANIAYTAAKNLPCNTTLTNPELGGLTLIPVRSCTVELCRVQLSLFALLSSLVVLAGRLLLDPC